MFVHLHNHTKFSELDGLTQIKPMVAKAKADGQPALAITDHGRCSGLVEFHDACLAEGINPILGCEFYEAPRDRFDKTPANGKNYYHLILLAKNEEGYKNLCRLNTLANTEGFYYKPRIDAELLKRYHGGLICLSACVAGRIPQLILSGDMVKAEKAARWYRNLFGEDFYFEIQNHGLAEEAEIAQGLVMLSQRLGIKLVCTNDTHYLNPDDKEAHDILLCVQTSKKLDDKDRLRYEGDYSLRPEAEMRQLFPNLQEAFDNTVEIANKCNFRFSYAKSPSDYRMPKVNIPAPYGDNYFGYMADEAWKGYEERYPEDHPLRNEAKTRLEYELSVIKEMGFAQYFLDTRATIMEARSRGILVGPGRGSAAGSCMCYCLKITDIEPIRYGLLFERKSRCVH